MYNARVKKINFCLTERWVFASIQGVKSILRKIIFYGIALFLTAQASIGVSISGGLTTYVVGAVVLSLLFMIVKPILGIITLPLNIITLGLFSFLINAIILYFLTILVPNISITAFEFKGLSFLGFVVPKLSINSFFAFAIASIIISLIVEFLRWLIKK
jgi:putative membrane protein